MHNIDYCRLSFHLNPAIPQFFAQLSQCLRSDGVDVNFSETFSPAQVINELKFVCVGGRIDLG